MINKISKLKIIPVLTLNSLSDAKDILNTLKEGGIKIAEITFRTQCAEKALRFATEKYPDFLIGAGTILNKEQAEKAIQNGANFIVGPGFSDAVCKVCKEKGVLYLPGCVTPTEIMRALEHDISVVKFFPANIFGGIKGIKALSAVFPQVSFIPTGGVNLENIDDYLSFEKIPAVGGSWMSQGEGHQIAEKIRECFERIKKIK